MAINALHSLINMNLSGRLSILILFICIPAIYGNKYLLLESDKGSYDEVMVADVYKTSSCVGYYIYRCNATHYIEESFEDIDCEIEEDLVEIECNVDSCQCLDKLPNDYAVMEYYKDSGCEATMQHMLYFKDGVCTNNHAFYSHVKMELNDTHYKFSSYSGDSCTETPSDIKEGKLEECGVFQDLNVRVTQDSGAESLNFMGILSIMVIAVLSVM